MSVSASFDLAYSSDLLRAQRTAELLVAEKKLPVTVVADLREHSMGQWEGQSQEYFDAVNRDHLEKYVAVSEQEKWDQKVTNDVESDAEVKSRFVRFLRRTALDHAGKTILVVTHGGVMRCLLVHLGWGTHKELPIGCVSHLEWMCVRVQGDDFVLEDVHGVSR